VPIDRWFCRFDSGEIWAYPIERFGGVDVFINARILPVMRPCCLGVLVFLLTACSASQYAPVQELGYSRAKLLSDKSVQATPAAYQVKPGDTLFAIAWRFGWDYKQLAKVNSIDSPYTIYVGQMVYFNAVNSNNALNKPVPKGAVKKPVVSANKPTIKLASLPSPIAPKVAAKKPYQGASSVKWSWPLRGKILQGFSNQDSASHGIDLSSSLGKSVKAAASGIIVYAGSGIQGYGKLVVVKHNDSFLSAYAYNSRILVAEGATVKAGQTIAEVGKGPQLDPRLHFEIRKNGKPVNPLSYLPKI
jgi:lipoprotein NlpD